MGARLDLCGHASQVPKPGDFITCDIAAEPVPMLRQPDAAIRVLRDRCAPKGARLLSDRSGPVGRFLRRPYHN